MKIDNELGLAKPPGSAPKMRAPALPPSLPPRGLSRTEAAAYIGVSPTLFDELVRDGRMPKAKRINARAVWDRHHVDRAFDAISDNQDHNPWDGEAA